MKTLQQIWSPSSEQSASAAPWKPLRADKQNQGPDTISCPHNLKMFCCCSIGTWATTWSAKQIIQGYLLSVRLGWCAILWLWLESFASLTCLVSARHETLLFFSSLHPQRGLQPLWWLLIAWLTTTEMLSKDIIHRNKWMERKQT